MHPHTMKDRQTQTSVWSTLESKGQEHSNPVMYQTPNKSQWDSYITLCVVQCHWCHITWSDHITWSHHLITLHHYTMSLPYTTSRWSSTWTDTFSHSYQTPFPPKTVMTVLIQCSAITLVSLWGHCFYLCVVQTLHKRKWCCYARIVGSPESLL